MASPIFVEIKVEETVDMNDKDKVKVEIKVKVKVGETIDINDKVKVKVEIRVKVRIKVKATMDIRNDIKMCLTRLSLID